METHYALDIGAAFRGRLFGRLAAYLAHGQLSELWPFSAFKRVIEDKSGNFGVEKRSGPEEVQNYIGKWISSQAF